MSTRKRLGEDYPIGTTVSVSFNDTGEVVGYWEDPRFGWKLVVHLSKPAMTPMLLEVQQCIVHPSNITFTIKRNPVAHCE